MGYQDVPGFTGLFGISVAVVVTSVGITVVTGTCGHWPFVLTGLGAGWLSARSINR